MTPITWGELAAREPELAEAGEALFRSFTLAYLATVARDGVPRIAPVTVTLHDGGLFAFVRAGTPKAQDLARVAPFALHSFPRFPTDDSFDDEEFSIRGTATLVEDEGLRAAVASKHNDSVEPGSLLYRLDAGHALHKRRVAGRPAYRRWSAEPG